MRKLCTLSLLLFNFLAIVLVILGSRAPAYALTKDDFNTLTDAEKEVVLDAAQLIEDLKFPDVQEASAEAQNIRDWLKLDNIRKGKIRYSALTLKELDNLIVLRQETFEKFWSKKTNESRFNLASLLLHEKTHVHQEYKNNLCSQYLGGMCDTAHYWELEPDYRQIYYYLGWLNKYVKDASNLDLPESKRKEAEENIKVLRKQLEMRLTLMPEELEKDIADINGELEKFKDDIDKQIEAVKNYLDQVKERFNEAYDRYNKLDKKRKSKQIDGKLGGNVGHVTDPLVEGILIYPGSFSGTVEVTFESLPKKHLLYYPYVPVSSFYVLWPHRLSLAVPATLTLPYDPSEDHKQIDVYWLNEEGSWEAVKNGRSIDPDLHTISVNINHLSMYAVMKPKQITGYNTSWLILSAIFSMLAGGYLFLLSRRIYNGINFLTFILSSLQ